MLMVACSKWMVASACNGDILLVLSKTESRLGFFFIANILL